MEAFYQTIFWVCGIGAIVMCVWTVCLCIYWRIWRIVSVFICKRVDLATDAAKEQSVFQIEREILFVHTEDAIEEMDTPKKDLG